MKNRTYGVAEFSLCAIFAAALSACGGGSGGSAGAAAAAAAVVDSVGDTQVSALAVGNATDSSAPATDTSALAAKAFGDAAGALAVEGGTFTVSGTQVVQYGVGDSWISKSVSGSGTCSNDFFGKDPLYGTAKSCQLVSPAIKTLAAEGSTFKVSGMQTVQYGAGTTWVTKTVSGSGTCSNDFFGNDPAYGVVKSCQVQTASVAALATDGGALAVTGSQVVQYGATDRWVTKRVSASGTCSTAFFGMDPAVGAAKSCQLATTPSAAIALAAEGKTFSVSGTQAVQYGAGTTWVSKSVTGSGTCSNSFFGKDPIPGTVKSCQLPAGATTFAGIVAAAAPVTLLVPAPASGTSPVSEPVAPTVSPATPTVSPATATPSPTLADEFGTFAVTGLQTVEFGANTSWTSLTVTGTVSCTALFFGADPAPGVGKSCRLKAASASQPSLMPTVDLSKLPARAAGFSTDRITAANVADPTQVPGYPAESGAFRDTCAFSHMSYDDPIVFPGSTGPHLHTFFGNTGASSNSTAQSLMTTGNSTCAGGTLNRTAYWLPTVIDTKDGTPIAPTDAIFYYKQPGNNPAASVRPFPPGLRMITGNPQGSVPQILASFTCMGPGGDGAWHKEIPTCPVGTHLVHSVSFPACWDGVNLDSPDHRAHMAYSLDVCPSTHPVPLPAVSLQVGYSTVVAADAAQTSRWRLSSDNYDKSLPGGYSAHADWFYGWNTDVMKTWVTNCLNKQADCHAFLVGDGRTLY